MAVTEEALVDALLEGEQLAEIGSDRSDRRLRGVVEAGAAAAVFSSLGGRVPGAIAALQ
ncbi:hypothetical protein RGF97_31485 [Streptomyces roseicoloratus]|uniref:Uncharacterized protein n=1 Tax=Streptomyces roseicoloratus TaxID=2508722 RepID=A0ABY9S4U6_9ACTN|nr:hypothetical protein [Streptomyces roseicoloratus]WMX48419.1 hypothetical protein RGF97_31485 [Streptomyces roseicoloratus]